MLLANENLRSVRLVEPWIGVNLLRFDPQSLQIFSEQLLCPQFHRLFRPPPQKAE